MRLASGSFLQLVVDQPQRAAQQPHRVGMEEGVRLLGLGKEADQVDGIALEHVRVGDVEAAVVDAEVAGGADLAARAPAERIEQAGEPRPGLVLLDLQRRAYDGGEVADILGDEEVVLHEALDRTQAAAADVAQPLGHDRLHVEGQPLLGSAGQEMQMAADGPEEILAPAEGGVFVGGEHLELDRAGAGAVAIQVFRQPVQRVQVAQAALAVLDVGLHAIARLAGTAVTLVALGHLRLDELARRAADDLAPEALGQFVVERPIAEDQARIEQRRADGDIGLGELERLLDRARGMADLEPQVPQEVEHVLHHALAPGRLLVGQQEQEIDVGERSQQTAAVAAGGHDCHVLGVGGIGGAIDVGNGVVEDEADELVLEQRQALRTAPAVAIVGELLGGLGARGPQQLLQPLQHGGTRRMGGAVLAVDVARQFSRGLLRVEIGGLEGDALVHRAQQQGLGARQAGGASCAPF